LHADSLFSASKSHLGAGLEEAWKNNAARMPRVTSIECKTLVKPR
jgi:hypothetical protein